MERAISDTKVIANVSLGEMHIFNRISNLFLNLGNMLPGIPRISFCLHYSFDVA